LSGPSYFWPDNHWKALSSSSGPVLLGGVASRLLVQPALRAEPVFSS
jgi:hypothetical protein